MESLDFQKVQILLAEYATLRSEIVARVGHVYQLIGVGVPLITLLFVTLRPLQFNPFMRHRKGRAVERKGQVKDRKGRVEAIIFWSVALTFAAALYWMIESYARDVRNAATRIREIEVDVNNRAGEDLLVWENLKGDVATGFWLWDWGPPLDRSALANVRAPTRTFEGKPIK